MTGFNTFFVSKCLIPVKVIHQTVLAMFRTVNSLWLLRMDLRCRTAESASAHHKFKGFPAFSAVISLLMSYMPKRQNVARSANQTAKFWTMIIAVEEW